MDASHASDKVKSGSFTLEEVMESADYARKLKAADTKKRKWAVNFGYLGTRYQGLQMNPNANTVEKHLERALFLAGTVSDSNFADLHKIQWTRTARTDRGVHAVMQCCAMKLLIPLDDREMFMQNINSFLPSDIRIHSFSKVSKGFNSKLQCTKRRYHYILPTYLLQDTSSIIGLLDDSLLVQGKITDAGLSGGYAELGSNKFLGCDALRSVRDSMKLLRLDPSRLILFRAALKGYEGTHKYHNFTTDKHPSDASSSRYVLSFTCGEPFIDPATDSEWISLSVLGQSFLLNQIRKMIGLACDIASGRTAITTMSDAMSDKKVDVPMAPGLGLYLDEVFFENYNINQAKQALLHNAAAPVKPLNDTGNVTIDPASPEKPLKDMGNVTVNLAVCADSTQPKDNEVGETGEAVDNEPSLAEPIDWTQDELVSARMTAFREGTVWPHILQEESDGLEFMFYLDSLRVHPNSYHPSAFKAKATTPYANDTKQGSGREGGRASGRGGGRASGRGGGRGRGGRGQEDDRRKRQKTD